MVRTGLESDHLQILHLQVPIAILFIHGKLSQHTICLSEFTNNFVDLSVHQQNSTVVCKFLKWKNGTKSKCSIAFRLNEFESCNVSSNSSLEITSQLDTDNVILRLNSQRLSPGEYCLVVTATSGSFTAMLTGNFIVTGNVVEYL